MMRYYISSTEALRNLRADQSGVISFGYIIVAACVIAAVAAVFSTNAGTGVGLALKNALDGIVAMIPAT